MRIRQLLLLTVSLLLLSGTVMAQPDSPVIRTPEDIAAREQLNASVETRGMYRSDVSQFEIPLTIKVGITGYLHCSDWLNAGQPIEEVLTMDFKEYVKNVLPNEWVQSWDADSLKAGAVAAKTFAWNHMVRGFPRPEGVDVVDNTCDQVFIRNSKRETTSAAVDDTWHYRMSLDNNIPEVHYLAYDWQCQNYGWAMCMGQWDSQDKALAGWSWEEILYHYYPGVDISITSTIAPNRNIVTNGKFNSGTTAWKTWGGIKGAGVVDGVYQFYRKSGSANPATVYQDMNYRVPGQTPLRLTLQLGNSSPVEKSVSVHVRNVDSWTDAISCTFTLSPGIALQKYTVWGASASAWAALRVEVQGTSDDEQAAYRLDKLNVQYKPTGKPTDVANCEAPLPGQPVILQPGASTTHGKQFAVLLQAGKSNLRPGYSPAYHVQVSRQIDFATTIFDNGAALASTPQVDVTATGGDGVYYVRARQFDGIDRYSRWTGGVLFNVVVLPGKPTLNSPTGETSADGLVFSWSLTEDTTKYKLWVRNSAGVKVVSRKLTPAQANCDLAACSTLGVTLPNGAYTWRVGAMNANGETKSDTGAFTVVGS